MSDNIFVKFSHRPCHHRLFCIFWKQWRGHQKLHGSRRASLTLSWVDGSSDQRSIWPSLARCDWHAHTRSKQVHHIGRASPSHSNNIASVINVSKACLLPRLAEKLHQETSPGFTSRAHNLPHVMGRSVGGSWFHRAR